MKSQATRIQTDRTAVIAVDLQYDSIVAKGVWPITDPKGVLANARKAIDACRAARLPIIYTQHWLDPRGVDAMRYEPVTRGGRPTHSVAGSAMAAICKEVAPHPGDIILRKQRFTAFYGTSLDLMLNKMDIDHLIMLGVWTEACFETTVWDAIWRDYRITIVKDACGTATDLMHMTSILDLANWLYGGMILNADELVKGLAGRDYEAWRFTAPNSYPYTLETVEEMYNSIGAAAAEAPRRSARRGR